MFEFLTLPLVITCLLMAIVIGAVDRLAPRIRASRSKVMAWTIVICCLAFIPSCTAIMIYVIDPLRFGAFEYQDYHSVYSGRVKSFLPQAAEEISAHVGEAGFKARFSITRKGMDDWLALQWRGADLSMNTYSPPSPDGGLGQELMKREFGDGPLTLPEEALTFKSPRARNGRGSTIYFSETQGIAYQETGYW